MLTEEVVSKIWIATIDGDNTFAGVSGLKGYNNQKRIGEFPSKNRSYIDAFNTERRSKHLMSDKTEVYHFLEKWFAVQERVYL